MKRMKFEKKKFVKALSLVPMLASVIVSMLALGACSSVSTQFAPSLPSAQFPARTAPDKIELYRSQIPTKPYTEIGVVNACCGADTNELIELLKQKASQAGGDAILQIDIQAVGGATASVIRYQTP